jgi:Ca-activated chloride channel family protein
MLMLHRARLTAAALLTLSAACSDVNSNKGVSDSPSAHSSNTGGNASVPGDSDEPTSAPVLSGDGDGDSSTSSSSMQQQPAEVANPFVDAKKDPFSTFAADVDTASYDYFRQTVGEYKMLPQADYVRIEDFVNFFRYAYPAPTLDAKEPFAIALAAAPHPMGRATELVRVGVQAKAWTPADKQPANLVFLVDTSGSMSSPDKLPLVQLMLKETLNVLSATDKVSVVSYAGDVSVRLEPTAVSDKKKIEDVIDALESGGGTAGASGIELAYQQATKGLIKDGINHVVLCTDGDFNLGLSSDDELVALIKSKRATGITLTAIGFGHDNLNDGMMEKVSNAGNGMYSVVYDQDQAVKYANERMLSTMIHVAKDMKIQVEWNPTLVQAYRLLGYEDRAVADSDFRNDLVDGGEVGAGHRVTALYEVVLSGEQLTLPDGAPALSDGEKSDLMPEIAADELVRVRIRYKQPGAQDKDPAYETVRSLKPADMAKSAEAADDDFKWAAAVATFAEVLRNSPFASRTELDKVATLLTAQKELDSDRREFAGLFDQARAMLP